MKKLGFGLSGALMWALLATTSFCAHAANQNSIESMVVAQQGNVINVKITFAQALTVAPPGFSVASPPRIALDFADTVNGLGKTSQVYDEGGLKSTNIVQAEKRTRLVFNLTQAMTYQSTIEGKSLLLALTPGAKQGGAPAVSEKFSQANPMQAANASIKDIAFRRGKDGEARILVDLGDPNTGIDIRQQGKNLIVDFAKTNVPDTLRKRLDVTDFGTPVVSVNTTQQGGAVRMTITPKGLWEHNAYQSERQFVIEVKPIIEDPNKLVQGTRGGYQGEKLSLNFQNVEVRRLLQVIGEFTGMNMVVSDSVGGSITLILKDVPWDQALDIILQQKGLDMRKNGNVILIAPREEISTKEKLEYEAKAQIGELEPLRTESFQMNYVKGEAIKKLLIDPKQTLLSKRGSALLDDRSNMLFVQDTPSRLDDVREMIAKVDVPVRQVIIEARIVEAGDSFSKNLGFRLATGSPTVTTDKDGNKTLTTSFDPKLYPVNQGSRLPYSAGFGSMNLPALPRAGTAGRYELSVFNSDYSRFLSAEISALEADGKGKVVSSPRIMTANQVEALIEQGVEIPYQEASSSGASTVSFKKANLSLKVKPQITPDGKVTMTIDINKDTPNASLNTGGAGVAIDTKHVKTEVLVENGGTIVIGGIFTQTTSTNTQKIPFFGDLPYIGWLFKNREWIDDKSELLIFITPRIVAEGLALR